MGEIIKKVELLSPARNFDTAKVAIDCGADAVYIGGSSFGARKDASNNIEDIRRTVEYARRYGVRVYATLNTVLFDAELDAARKLAIGLIEAGVDALIVQDVAYLRMGLKGVEFHASTQMFNSSAEQAQFLSQCGFSRIILERNLSLKEIRAIGRACDADLECFVHGAVCVCYSGRCAMSLSLGCGSGNRGTCSQPCRLKYDLVDEKGRCLVRSKHLLSVRDLDLSKRIGDLIDAGVTSFKIEGRLKDKNYVSNVTAFYRRAVDDALTCREGYCRSSYGETQLDFKPDLSKSFTRSGSSYYFDGLRMGVASFDTPKSVGEYAGVVGNVWRDCFELEKKFGFSSGDGICYMVCEELCGTNINKVDSLRIYPNKMDGIVKGVSVYRNYDHKFNQQLDREHTVRLVGVKIDVQLSLHEIVITVADCRGNAASESAALGGDKARNPQMVIESVKSAVLKSGGTMFRVDDVNVKAVENVPFVASSTVNELRRKVLAELQTKIKSMQCDRDLRSENMQIKYPRSEMNMSENVVNSLSENFYLSHGVEQIEKGVDLRNDFYGVTVMRTRYCLRRELGQCLKGYTDWQGTLFLVRGIVRYQLDFDCDRCEMKVIKTE